MASDLVLGIDLGTTYSAVAYVDEQGTPRVIPNADGKTTTPSVVLIKDGRMTVGEAALNQWITDEEHVVRWIKRAMGAANYAFQGHSPVEISAEILKSLKRDAEVYLGQAVAEAVITCPAYFASVEIENTKRAGELAGLQVREIVKEPTAAAVYYGIGHMREGETILVCDLGGGTFDACVLSLAQGAFIPRASAGDREMGGHDWTLELVALVAERVVAQTGVDPRDDRVAAQLLYEACEQAKRSLARLSQVSLPCTVEGRLEQIQVSREDFEARTEWLFQKLVLWTDKALEKCRPSLHWGDVHRILLVGGASRLRRMKEVLAAASGQQPELVREPDLAVALGAAMLAAGRVRPRPSAGGLAEVGAGGLVEIDFQRTISRSLGTRVITWVEQQPQISNSLIIPHGTPSPTSRNRDDYEVSADGQPSFDLPVVEFESDEDYEVVGSYRFALPPAAQRGDPVSVSFDYDVSGIVTVAATHAPTGMRLAVERRPYEEPDIGELIRLRVRPRWVIFAIDISGSMEGLKLVSAKQALQDATRHLLTATAGCAKVGIVSFASHAEIACPPTSDLTLIQQAVDRLVPWGTTAMDQGIRQAIELLDAAPRGTQRDIVMVTDGQPDHREATVSVAEETRRRGIALLNLGIGSQDVDLNFLNELTPQSIVIDRVEQLSQTLTTLLTQAVGRPVGGLMEPEGGLRERP